MASSPQRIGKYEVREPIGQGGFGCVYRAFDPQVGRQVAIKVLTAFDEPDTAIRFQNEAAATGNLRHPNIVTIYDYGTHGKTPYIVMELLEGQDLQQVLNSGRQLSLLEKMNVMAQAASGLHCAHINGVVHRDIKPANIMLLSDDSVKLMDFGIALLTRVSGQRLTQQGSIIGTVSYMSPEHFLGKQVGPVSDIFSFGIIYYRLLTGRHPFDDREAPVVMYNITARDPEPISSLCPDLPEGLSAVVERALAKDPELRYQSLDDLILDTEPILRELRQEKARNLIEEAREFADGGDYEGARRLIRSTLLLDPDNGDARQLREEIQQYIQKRSLQPRIRSLVDSAEEELKRRQYEPALRKFEAAYRLDRNNTSLRLSVEHVKALIDQSAAADKLINEARSSLNREDLTTAFRLVNEARRIDPSNPQVEALLLAVQQQIESREQDRQLQAGLSRARGLILIHAFDRLLGELDDWEKRLGARPELLELRKEAIAAQAEQQRQRTLQAEIDSIKRLIHQQQFEEANAQAVALRSEYPASGELTKLARFIDQELQARQRIQAIENITAQSRSATEANDFKQAIAILEDATRAYPGEVSLTRLLESTLEARADYQRKQAIEEAARKAEDLRSTSKPEEALAVVNAAIMEFGETSALDRLRRDLTGEIQQRARERAVGEVIQQAESLLCRNRPREALDRLRAGARTWPDENSIALAIEKTASEVANLERRQFIEKQLSAAVLAQRSGDFPKALGILATARARYPDAPEIGDAIEVTHRAETAALAQDCLLRVGSLQREGKLHEAIDVISTLVRERGPIESLSSIRAELENQAEQLRRAEAIRMRISQAQAMIAAGNPEEAVNLIRDSILKAGENDELSIALAAAELAAETRRKQQFSESNKTKALEREKAGDVRGALEIVETALTAQPDAIELHPIATRLRNFIEQEDKLQVLGEIDQLRTSGDLQGALQTVTRLLSQFGTDASLQKLHNKLTKDLELAQRENAIQDSLSRAHSMVESGRLEAALEYLRTVEKQHGFHAVIDTRVCELKQAVSEQAEKTFVAEQLALATDLEKRGFLAPSLSLMEAALSRYPAQSRLISEAGRIRRRIQEVENTATEGQVGLVDRALEVGDYAAAVDASRAGIERWPKEHRFKDRLSKAEAELRRVDEANKRARDKQLDEEISIKETEIRQALDMRAWVRAKELINSLLNAYPERRQQLVCWQETAQKLLKRDIDERLREIDTAFSAAELDHALKLVDLAKQAHPEEAAFLRWKNRLDQQSAHAAEARRKAAEARIESALAEGDWTRAFELIGAARQAYPDHKVFRRLRELADQKRSAAESAARRAAAEEQQRDIAARQKAIDESINSGDWQLAFQLIKAAQNQYPTHGWASIKARAHTAKSSADAAQRQAQDVVRSKDTTSRIEAIERAISKEDFTQAFELIGAATQAHASDTRFSLLKAHVEAERAFHTARTQIAAGQLEGAAKTIRVLKETSKDKKRLQELATRLASAELLAQLIREAEDALAAHDIKRASASIAKAKRIDPDSPSLSRLDRMVQIVAVPPSPIAPPRPPVAHSQPSRRLVVGGAAVLIAFVVFAVAQMSVGSNRPVPPLTGQGILASNPPSIRLSWQKGSQQQPMAAISLTGTEGGYQVTSSQSWLNAAPLLGRIPSNLTLSVDPQKLGVGQHAAAAAVIADNGNRIVIPVEVHILEATPEVRDGGAEGRLSFQLNVSAMKFIARQRQAAPEPQQVSIAAPRSVGLTLSARVSGGDWVSVSQAPAGKALRISVNHQNLAPGIHEALVTITGSTANHSMSQRLPVTLFVEADPHRSAAVAATDAPKPSVTPHATETPKPTPREIPDFGLMESTVTWRGNLAAEKEVVITRTGGNSQSGALVAGAARLPIGAFRIIAVSPLDVDVMIRNGSDLVLKNKSGKPVSHVSIDWRRQ